MHTIYYIKHKDKAMYFTGGRSLTHDITEAVPFTDKVLAQRLADKTPAHCVVVPYLCIPQIGEIK